MPVEEDAEIMTPYEDYSVEELKEAYYKLFYLADFNDADLEEMDRILAVLQEKDPLPPTHSVDELREEFYSLYLEDLADTGIHEEMKSENEEVVGEKPKPVVVLDGAPSEKKAPPVQRERHRKVLLRACLIAAILVVLLAAVTVTAAAMGYNLWGWLPVWNEEDIRFVAETPRETANELDLQNIPMVLESLGISELLYPTWLPEGFVKTEANVFEEPLFLHETYKDNDRELIITISPTTGSENTIYQKTKNPPVEYIADGVVHYIFDNNNETTAAWYTESYTTTIVGNVSLEEMKRIINSVYEVK